MNEWLKDSVENQPVDMLEHVLVARDVLEVPGCFLGRQHIVEEEDIPEDEAGDALVVRPVHPGHRVLQHLGPTIFLHRHYYLNQSRSCAFHNVPII